MEVLGGAEHPEEPDDAEVEAGSFSIAMLGMVEVDGEIFVGVTHGPDIKLGFPPQMLLVVAVIFLTPTCLLDRSDKSDTRKSRPRVERHSGIVMSIAMTTTMVATKTTATTTRKRK